MVEWEALDALSHQLELCDVDAKTRLVVLIDPDLDPDQVTSLRVALARSSANAIEVRISPNQCAGNEPLAAAIRAADLLITTGAHRAKGTQILHLHSISPEHFSPHVSLRRRVNTLVGLIEDATRLTVSDANGTHVEVALANGKVTFDHGFVDDVHRYACFPSGWVEIMPAASTVHGQLVLMPGDANLNASQLISSPIVLQLVDDHIAAIEGDRPDGDVLRALLEHPDDPSAYGVARLNIGMNPSGVERQVFDDRLIDPVVSQLLAGIVQISFGNNLVADRPCNQTVTMALPARTVHLDELPIVVDGQLQGNIAPDVYEL